MWQEIIVGLCVFAAIVFLAWRWLPIKRKKTSGCDSGCGSCGSAKTCSTTPAKSGDTKPGDS